MQTADTIDDAMKALNAEQSAAVRHDGAPLAVLAGPGTGKTRVIVSRIARLVRDGAAPSSILGLTFGVKAAKEMRDRLVELLGPRQGSDVALLTFHSYGRRFVARYGDIVGHRVTPRLMDSAQLKRLLSELIVTNGLFADMRAMGVERAVAAGREFIEKSVHAGRDGADARAFAREIVEKGFDDLEGDDAVAAHARLERFEQCAELYALYEIACAERGLVSMSDYVMMPVRILRANERVRSIVRSETKHIVVDEFQDVNLCQIELLRDRKSVV